MTESKSEKEIGRLLKAYYKEEARRPELQEEKRAFILSHFSNIPVLSFFNYVPASVLVLMLLALVWIQVPRPASVEEGAVREVIQMPPMSAIPPGLDRPVKPVPVIVKRVSSSMGPTLVYQETFENKPITIIWVLPGGK